MASQDFLRMQKGMGTANGPYLTSDSHETVQAYYFPEYFDKIVVDAPCSGEGMFRKDEGARAEWSSDKVRLCAQRQVEILENASQC